MSTTALVHSVTDLFGGRHRTKVVWAAFVSAMTVAGGVFLLADGTLRSVSGAPMLGPGIAIERPTTTGLFELPAALDEDRWEAIVIHHSGSPAGDAETLDRMHQSFGLEGLGYHFVIGNGDGMGDGVIHVGYRWTDQKPGAHVIGSADVSEWYNRRSIGICLIGNGEARGFTERQMRSLARLVQDLQGRFDIPAERVVLHRDLGNVRSPGRYFPEATFREQLLDAGR